jgi:hypothetical protein
MVSGKGENGFDVPKEIHFSRRQSQQSHIIPGCSVGWVFLGKKPVGAKQMARKKLGPR